MSIPVSARRELARQRAAAAVFGLSAADYRLALLAAYLEWSRGRPWCWLPEFLRGAAFEWFGRRFAGEAVARYAEAWHGR